MAASMFSFDRDRIFSASFNSNNNSTSNESEEDQLETIVQFAEYVIDFSSQYGSEGSMSYSASNLAGKPSVRTYGDSPWAFANRTFGVWWDNSKSTFKEQDHAKYPSQDYVELSFKRKVYPTRLDVFETYNPGSVVRIFAFNANTSRWQRLWCTDRLETNLPPESRIFSPPLCNSELASDLIRLEFHHGHVAHYPQLDAVRLVGSVTKARTLPTSSSAPAVPIQSLLFRSYAGHTDRSVGLNAVCSRLENLTFAIAPSLGAISTTRRRGERVRRGMDGASYFDLLPREVTHLIVSFLDLPSRCRFACTSRMLRGQCYDPLLYSELDLQPYWDKVTKVTLSGLESRCQNVQRLRLSWTGNYGRLTSQTVVNFISVCGRHLVCLHLANCEFVDNELLSALFQIAPQLEDLDIQCCQQTSLDQLGFRQITSFSRLQRLNLYRTAIDLVSVLLILRCCQRLEFLNLGNCYAISNFDEIAHEIGHSCRGMTGLDLWRAKSLTAAGVTSIANNCPLLEDLNIGWCLEVYSNSGCIVNLAEKCRNLRKLCLAALRTVNDNDILTITSCCSLLEQLDILGTRDVSVIACSRLLADCQNLTFLDVSFCEQIDFGTIEMWKRNFTNVNIVKSVPCKTPFS